MIIAVRKHKSPTRSLRPSLLLPVLVLAAGGFAISQDGVDDATLSAGSFTIRRFDRQAFSESAPVLTHKQRHIFMLGRNVFNRQWAAVTSLNGDWGLGPTFIADRCSACHVNTGRGSLPASSDEQLLSLLVRVSIPGNDVMLSLRMAPPLVGIGFLDAVTDETILAIAANQKSQNLNGRPNRVWDAVNKRMALGRYGWKANVPNLK